MKKYLTVGTDDIKEDFFIPVHDSNNPKNIKPTGGLWLTEYINPNYNTWVSFMLNHIYILFYRNPNSPFTQPCSIIELKDEKGIYILNDKDSLDYLMINYPHPITLFSYQSLSQDYNGIYIDLSKLCFDKSIPKEIRMKFTPFDINTTLLFTPHIIEHFQPAVLEIEPFDPEEYDIIEDINYTIKPNGNMKTVGHLPDFYHALLEIVSNFIKAYLDQQNLKYEDLNRELIRQIFNEALKFIPSQYKENIDEKMLKRTLMHSLNEKKVFIQS